MYVKNSLFPFFLPPKFDSNKIQDEFDTRIRIEFIEIRIRIFRTSQTCTREQWGSYTRPLYLRLSPIEPSLMEFLHTQKIPIWSDRDSNPRLRAQKQCRNQLSHPTTLALREDS